jgi:AraC-like DNA-binding protein
MQELAETVRHIQDRYDEPLRIETLARKARRSAYQLNRRVCALFGLTPAQLIIDRKSVV